jgi:hypothetical protein
MKKLDTYASTYSEHVEYAIVFIDTNGESESAIEKLREKLPNAWASDVIADALKEIQER